MKPIHLYTYISIWTIAWPNIANHEFVFSNIRTLFALIKYSNLTYDRCNHEYIPRV